MANPQLENGYTRIANELLEALTSAKFSGRELQVVLFVIRKTYGYGKKNDRISLGQFKEDLQIDHRFLCRILSVLVDRKILNKNCSQYGINKNYDEWVVARRPLVKVVAYKPLGSGAQATRSSGVQTTHKRKKENIQKKEKTFFINEYEDNEINEMFI